MQRWAQALLRQDRRAPAACSCACAGLRSCARPYHFAAFLCRALRLARQAARVCETAMEQPSLPGVGSWRSLLWRASRRWCGGTRVTLQARQSDRNDKRGQMKRGVVVLTLIMGIASIQPVSAIENAGDLFRSCRKLEQGRKGTGEDI